MFLFVLMFSQPEKDVGLVNDLQNFRFCPVLHSKLTSKRELLIAH